SCDVQVTAFSHEESPVCHLRTIPTRRSSDLSCPRPSHPPAKARRPGRRCRPKGPPRPAWPARRGRRRTTPRAARLCALSRSSPRSEEHTSELQSRENLVCRLLLEKQKKPDKI